MMTTTTRPASRPDCASCRAAVVARDEQDRAARTDDDVQDARPLAAQAESRVP
jgi:hypothetical protein